MTPEERYRLLWEGWLQAKTPQHRSSYEAAMDACQLQIALSPRDPKWAEFLKTMPQSYHDYWRKAADLVQPHHLIHGDRGLSNVLTKPGRPN